VRDDPAPPLLDEATAAFIAGPSASLAIATRDASNRPSLVKAVACRVSADRRRVTLYLDQQLGEAVVRAVRAGFPVAAVFSEPATHRTLQLKADRAEVGTVSPAERELARQQFINIVEHISALAYPEDGVRCFFHYTPEQLVAVSFTPTEAFEQTPGPRAGARLQR
jgi:hypothetical protein